MSEPLRKKVGKAIRVLRRLRRLDVVELAERSTLSDVYLRQVEEGKRDLGLGALQKIANGLGCSPDYLVPDDGRNPASLIIGDAFANASGRVQRALLFLLLAPEDTPRKKALLTLLPAEFEPRRRPGRPPGPSKKRRSEEQPKESPPAEPPDQPPPAGQPKRGKKKSKR